MSNTTIEIIGGRERRRRWSADEKLRIVAATHEPGASVRAVAARHDVYPNLLRTWRRQVREGRLVASSPARFMPVHVAETAPTAVGIAPPNQDRAAAETVEMHAKPDLGRQAAFPRITLRRPEHGSARHASARTVWLHGRTAPASLNGGDARPAGVSGRHAWDKW
jgi:transposase